MYVSIHGPAPSPPHWSVIDVEYDYPDTPLVWSSGPCFVVQIRLVDGVQRGHGLYNRIIKV